MRYGFILILVLTIGLLPAPALATGDEAGANPAIGSSGLPVPRFVSTRSSFVNVRHGPGERYPVAWVLKEKGIPVQIVAEYDNWRKIEDWEGTTGWVHQALLSGRRSVAVYPGEAVLREKPEGIATPLARLAPGVIAAIHECSADWCNLKLGKTEGWVQKTALWGIGPDEIIK